MKLPDRWLAYKAMGAVIPGTRFVACKVPLKEGFLKKLPAHERFGPAELVNAFPNIGLLIDLTNTDRYYSKKEFIDKKIQYEKIYCLGHVLPANSIIKKFVSIVDRFLLENKSSDSVIVVHCTHGINRTGYFICRYMIEQMKMVPEEALKNFQQGRGYGIERENYVEDLRNGCKGGSESSFKNDRMPYYNKRENKDMQSKERQKRMDPVPNDGDDTVAVSGFNLNTSKRYRYTSRPDRPFKTDLVNHFQPNIHFSAGTRDSQLEPESWRKDQQKSFSSQQHADFYTLSAQARSVHSGSLLPRNFPNNVSSKYSWTKNTPVVSNNFTNPDAVLPPPNFRGQQLNSSWRPLPSFCYSDNPNRLPQHETSDGLQKTDSRQESFAESSTPNTQQEVLCNQDSSFRRIPWKNRPGPPKTRWDRH